MLKKTGKEFNCYFGVKNTDVICFGDTHVGNYGAIALDYVGAVMTLQHNIQVHQDPLVLILVSCTTHLLVTHTEKKTPKISI